MILGGIILTSKILNDKKIGGINWEIIRDTGLKILVIYSIVLAVFLIVYFIAPIIMYQIHEPGRFSCGF